MAVTGIEYCSQPTFPEWDHSVLLATLKDQSLWVLKLADNGKSVKATYRYPLLYTDDESEVRRLRDYCFSPDGRLFVSTSNIWSGQWNPDRIIEIKRVRVIPFEIAIIGPVNDAVSDGNVHLSWYQAAGDSRYQVQVSTQLSFDAEILLDNETSDTLVSVSLPSNERSYYWRVRELTSSGAWSLIDSFRVDLKTTVNATAAKQKLVVYPNPASLQQKVKILTTERAENGSIVSEDGKLIRHVSLEELGTKTIDLQGLSAGPYFISLSFSRGRTQLIPIHVLK